MAKNSKNVSKKSNSPHSTRKNSPARTKKGAPVKPYRVSEKPKKNFVPLIVSLTVFVIAIIVVIVAVNYSNNKPLNSGENKPDASLPAGTYDPHYLGKQLTPDKNIDASNYDGIIVGKDGEAGNTKGVPTTDKTVSVDIYFDYLCPFCGQFETTYHNKLIELVNAGKINLTIHPLTFLDSGSSGTSYSSRTASAAYYISQNAPKYLWDFSTALFQNQPEENSTGLTDEQIESIAKTVGVPDSVAKKLKDHNYINVAQTYNKAIWKTKWMTGTPVIRMNLPGKDPVAWSWFEHKDLDAVIKNVQDGMSPNAG